MGICGRGTEEPVSFHLPPEKRVSILPQGSPGVRLSSVLCRGCLRVRRESGFHRKQSWQAGQEYMHSCDTLVGYWNPNSGKEPPTVACFIALNGAAGKAEQAALAGGLGEPHNKQIFHFFAGAKIEKIAKCVPLCTACHY